MKYSNPETVHHQLAVAYSNCLKDLDEIIHNEDDLSPSIGNKFNSATVIDLDSIEVLKAQAERRQQNSTMDCTFAINDHTRTEMLLVEFRFNYSNLKRLNRNKLIDKVSGSLLLLGNSVPISTNYIFIFQKNLKAQAVSRLFRMLPQIPNNYIVMDVDDLVSSYF